MYKVRIEVLTDSRLQRESKKIYAYSLTMMGADGKAKGVIGVGSGSGTYHRTVLKAMNAALGRLNQNCIVTMTTEDLFVASRIGRISEDMQKQVHIGIKPDDPNREEWEAICRHMQHNRIFASIGVFKYKEKLQRVIETQKGVQDVG